MLSHLRPRQGWVCKCIFYLHPLTQDLPVPKTFPFPPRSVLVSTNDRHWYHTPSELHSTGSCSFTCHDPYLSSTPASPQTSIQLSVFVFPNEFEISFCLPMFDDGTSKYFKHLLCAPITLLLCAVHPALCMCGIVSSGRFSIESCTLFVSLLQRSQRELARVPIICSHFPHGNEHVITCVARLFLAQA